MEHLNYIYYATLAAAGTGFTAIVSYAVINVTDWLKERKGKRLIDQAQLDNYAKEWDEYTNALKTKIGNLEDDLRASMGQQLVLIDERNTLARRCKMLATEVACDPDKKTRVIER